MANMTSLRSRANPHHANPRRPQAVAALGALAALALAGLACGTLWHENDLNTMGQPGGPYWACATATPVPTERWIEQLTVTPGVVETIVHETTPVPTETPYYRTGEFFIGQGAVIDDFQVTLIEAQPNGEYGVATFRLENHSGTETTFRVTALVFAVDDAGNERYFDQEATVALGYPDPSWLEAEPWTPGEARNITLAFVGGLPAQFGFTVNNQPRAGAGAPPPVWFKPASDTVPCPYGQASWPIPQHGGNASQKPGASVIGQTPLGSAKYRITSPFGCSDWGSGSSGHCDGTQDYDHDGIPDTLLHHGIDLAAPAGIPIYAPLAGKVTFSGWSTAGYGNLLIVRMRIANGDYVWMYFAHQAQTPFVSEGESVKCGQNIGVLGTSGNSTGPHLHWEVRQGALASGPYGAYNIDPDANRASWEYICGDGGLNGPPYWDVCVREGAC